ncbi:hypothetical protein KJ636_02845 [Patescibacteria group bacterium]|nr:hypothetical protein [Patescibacteria group bacterium]
MQNPLKNLIEIIKTGSREGAKEAQKKVEKFWHEVYIPKREEGRKAFSIFLDEIKKFDQIRDVDKIDNKDFLDKGDLLEKKGFQMPKWMECNWRRVPCGKENCPICGRIKKDRQRLIYSGMPIF